VSLEPRAALDIMFGRCRPDALVAFGSRRPTKVGDLAPQYLWALRVRDLWEYLPGILEHQIRQTQYIKPSTLSTEALLNRTPEDMLEAVKRRRPLYYQAYSRHVMELAALVVDLDVGRDPSQPTAGQALGAVIDRSRAGVLPTPSLAGYSGRGVYLWWLLTDDRGRPPLNTRDNNDRRKLITTELVRRTSDLEPDIGASKDAGRWFKRPGTTDYNTGNEVVYMTFGLGHPESVPRYMLPDLVAALGLHYAPAELPGRRPAARLAPPARKGKGSNRPKPPKSGDPSAPHYRRAAEIGLLAQERGGIREGMRARALQHYYQSRRMYLLKQYNLAGEPDAPSRSVGEAQRATYDFNAAYCRPPMSAEEVEKAFCSLSGDGYHPRSTTVAEHLQITREEIERLDLVAIVTAEVRAERENAKAAKAEARAANVTMVEKMLKQGLSISEVARRMGKGKSYVHAHRKRLITAGELSLVVDEQGELIPGEHGEAQYRSSR